VVARRPLPRPRPLPFLPPAPSRRVLSPLSTAQTSARARPPTLKPSPRSPRRSAVARPRTRKSLLPPLLRLLPAQRRRRRRRLARASVVMLRSLNCPPCYHPYPSISGPLCRGTTRPHSTMLLPAQRRTKRRRRRRAARASMLMLKRSNHLPCPDLPLVHCREKIERKHFRSRPTTPRPA
jgi:hypothetical protein